MKTKYAIIAAAAIITLFTGCAPRSQVTANDPLGGTKAAMVDGFGAITKPGTDMKSLPGHVLVATVVTIGGIGWDIGRATGLISNVVPQSSDYYLTKEPPKDDNVTAQHEAKWKAELEKSLKSE